MEEKVYLKNRINSLFAKQQDYIRGAESCTVEIKIIAKILERLENS